MLKFCLILKDKCNNDDEREFDNFFIGTFIKELKIPQNTFSKMCDNVNYNNCVNGTTISYISTNITEITTDLIFETTQSSITEMLQGDNFL